MISSSHDKLRVLIKEQENLVTKIVGHKAQQLNYPAINSFQRGDKLRKVVLMVTLMGMIIILILAFTINGTRSSITITGSTTLLPLLNELAEKYNRQNGSAKHKHIIVQGGGSSLGIAYLNAGLVDASSESRFPKYNEFDTKKNNWQKKGVKTYLLGGDLIVFIVNLKNIITMQSNSPSFPHMTKLFYPMQTKQLNEIYTGEITNWSNIGIPKDGSKRNSSHVITPINRELGSGTRDVVYNGLSNYQQFMKTRTNHFCSNSKINNLATLANFPAQGLVASSNGEALSWVNSSPGNIAYVSFPFLKKIMEDPTNFEDRGLRIVVPTAQTNIPLSNKSSNVCFLSKQIYQHVATYNEFSKVIAQPDVFPANWKNVFAPQVVSTNSNHFNPYFFIHPLCVSGKKSKILTNFFNWFLPQKIENWSNNTRIGACQMDGYIPIITTSKVDKFYSRLGCSRQDSHKYQSEGTLQYTYHNYFLKAQTWSVGAQSNTPFQKWLFNWRNMNQNNKQKWPWWKHYFLMWSEHTMD